MTAPAGLVPREAFLRSPKISCGSFFPNLGGSNRSRNPTVGLDLLEKTKDEVPTGEREGHQSH